MYYSTIKKNINPIQNSYLTKDIESCPNQIKQDQERRGVVL